MLNVQIVFMVLTGEQTFGQLGCICVNIQNGVVSNCAVRGRIDANATYAAGLSAVSSYTKFEDCHVELENYGCVEFFDDYCVDSDSCEFINCTRVQM